MDFARFVGAVLAPHHAEDAQLGDVWLAPEDLLYARVFFGGEAVFGGDFRRYSDFGASGSHISNLREECAPARMKFAPTRIGALRIMPLPLRRRQALPPWNGK